MYCYVRRYETNGSRHYRRVAKYTSDGLLIFQLTMVGLLYLKGVLAAATTLVPLVVFTVWVKMKCHRLFQGRTVHPYIGKFHHAAANFNSTPPLLAEEKTWAGYWFSVVDDIWKLSYIKAWWVSGRYAQPQDSNSQVIQTDDDTIDLQQLQQQQQQEKQIRQSTSVGQSEAATVVVSDGVLSPKQSCSTEEVVDIHISAKEDYYHESVVEGTNRQDLTTYPDDSKSMYETYEHPALVTPIITQLILPLKPIQSYWDLKNCVHVPLETIQTIFDVYNIKSEGAV